MRKSLAVALFLLSLLSFPMQSQAFHLFDRIFLLSLDSSSQCTNDGTGLPKAFWILILDIGDGPIMASIDKGSSFNNPWGMLGTGKWTSPTLYQFSAWTIFEEGGWITLHGKVKTDRFQRPLNITGTYIQDGGFEHPSGCFASGRFKSTRNQPAPEPK